MMSLYDYLGRAAGLQLGEQVAKRATAMGVRKWKQEKFQTQLYTQVNVMLYPEKFLNEYFAKVMAKLRKMVANRLSLL